jgi:hypothetical protein
MSTFQENIGTNTLIVYCLECSKHTWSVGGQGIIDSGWYDPDAERISCPDHGIHMAGGILVGSIDDETGFRESMERWIKAQQEILLMPVPTWTFKQFPTTKDYKDQTWINHGSET